MAKKTYTIEFDEDRDRILTAIYAVIDGSKEGEALMKWLVKENLSTAFLALVKETADKQHELDWCRDPHCEDK